MSRSENLGRIPGVGMSEKLQCTLRASTVYNLAHTSAIKQAAVGCNTPYAPFRTETTSELPGYITFLNTAYDNVFVREARIVVEIVNSTVADSITTVLSYDADSSVSTDIKELSEQRYSKTQTLGYFSAGSNRTVHRGTFTPQGFLGINPNNSSNTCYGATDPADPYFWVISAKSVGGGEGNVAYRVTVEYDLEFSQLKSPQP